VKRFNIPDTAIPASAFNECEFNPDEMELVFEFDAYGWREPKALLKDKFDRLYLANAHYDYEDGVMIKRDANKVPIAETTAADFKKVTVKEALEWWARCEPWCDSSSGSMSCIGLLAAKLLTE
jgi:hypothetical protein